jgi:hypothetical protein
LGFTLISPQRIRFRLLCLYVAAFSLFWEAGYMVYGGIREEGDYIFFLRDIGAPELCRWLLIIAGFALYSLESSLLRSSIAGLGTGGEPTGRSRATRLLVPAWFGGLFAAVTAAAFYTPARLSAIGWAALEIGAASLPLLLIPRKLLSELTTGSPAPSAQPVMRSLLLIATALTLIAALAATLGRGVSLPSQKWPSQAVRQSVG